MINGRVRIRFNFPHDWVYGPGRSMSTGLHDGLRIIICDAVGPLPAGVQVTLGNVLLFLFELPEGYDPDIVAWELGHCISLCRNRCHFSHCSLTDAGHFVSRRGWTEIISDASMAIYDRDTACRPSGQYLAADGRVLPIGAHR